MSLFDKLRADTFDEPPADLKLRTQLGHRELAGARETDESMLLFHGGYLVPGHSPESVTHVLGITVTYVPGSYRFIFHLWLSLRRSRL